MTPGENLDRARSIAPAAQEFDLAVIGGGINGAAVARDAAMRGLSVALVDRGDFAGAHLVAILEADSRRLPLSSAGPVAARATKRCASANGCAGAPRRIWSSRSDFCFRSIAAAALDASRCRWGCGSTICWRARRAPQWHRNVSAASVPRTRARAGARRSDRRLALLRRVGRRRANHVRKCPRRARFMAPQSPTTPASRASRATPPAGLPR